MNCKPVILFLFLILAALTLQAQPPYQSTNPSPPRFEVDQVRGCAPLTVTITQFLNGYQCNGTSPCDMDYEGNNTFESLKFSHTYTTPGKYTMRVLFQASGFAEIPIEVYPNIQPEFDIYTCGGNQVQVKVTDTNYNQYVINYNDGSPDVIVPSGSLAKDSHTFGSSGPKNITVRGRFLNADDNCNAMTKPVDAVSSLAPPAITKLTVTASDQIQLDFDNKPNVIYKLMIATNGGNFQALQNVYNTTSVTVPNVRTDDNYYCFRLDAFDPCFNTTAASNTICSANFDLVTQNNVNKLLWATSSAGIASFAITKNGVMAIGIANAAAVSYDDTNVVCGTEYCYELTTSYINGSTSTSLLKCGKAFSTNIPSVVTDISSVVSDNTVKLQWTQDPLFTVKEYTMVKSTNGNFSTIGTTATPTFTDEAYAADAASCYRITYKDACDNASPASVDVCPIVLSGALQSDNSINLNWTDYAGYVNGVANYRVEKFDDQGNLLQTFDMGTAITLLDNSQDLVNQVYVYRVTGIANDGGLISSVSNTITMIKEPNLFYPTAFTPGNDGLNDVFKIFGQYTAKFEFKIFNRWGELLFITSDFSQGWDGTYKGNLMPEGTYVFRAKITDFIDRTSERSGTIVLFRRNK
ncbi:T9SS type B sorting domain-containing protein [Chryseolinea lacunae]|uniref:Gliding motility-associated C-terminal domain-containing protein n=1 Tax=Chryseolinea lacunae TaxID=2801331 RepID=A0ABS1KUC6_9BACT|nr:T9SS type B sorting domain-containing protein [Chryseolinea lacunae]MBL0742898.1 gliding motility-associated C-terminal domain-containing protein [Chryseolinea lacunae]